MTLRYKISLMIGGLVLGLMLILSTIMYVTQRNATTDQIIADLTDKRDVVLQEFASYLQSVEEDLNLWADLSVTGDALTEFSNAWRMISINQMEELQRQYITENPHPIGQKDKMTKSPADNMYGLVHSKFHPNFRELKNQRGYYDVFLMDTEGNLIYSVYKELDYATNLVDGEYADSGLGQVFRMARDANPQDIAFVDFAPYAPSYGAPASFIAKPVYSSQGKFQGVVAFQMPVDRFGVYFGELGNGNYAVLAGVDGALRVDDLRIGDGTALKETILGEAVDAAVAGLSGDYLGEHMGVAQLQASVPVQFHGVTWALIVEKEFSLAFAPLRKLGGMMLALSSVFFAVALGAAMLLGRSISQPMTRLSGNLRELMDGQKELKIGYLDRKDEIGEIAQSIDHFATQSLELEHLQEKQEKAKEAKRVTEAEKAAQEAEFLRQEKQAAEAKSRKREEQRLQEAAIAAEIAEVVDACGKGDFTKRIDVYGKTGVFLELCKGVNLICEVTNEGLADISVAMAALSGGDMSFRTSPHAGIFGAISEDVNNSMVSLSAIIEGIKSSGLTANDAIEEIASAADALATRTEQNAATLEKTHGDLVSLASSVQSTKQSANTVRGQSNDVVRDTADGIDILKQTVAAMQEIKTSSQEISQVVALIEDIAFQTNLLALNAGVEAARAGEAGSGFAVVASEVRNLAARSSEAAKEISQLIDQSSERVDNGVRLSGKSVQVLEGVATSVNEVSAQIDAIADASSEQDASVQNITASSNTLDQSTQQNAAMFEETTAAIRKMKWEFDTMMSEVKSLTVDAKPASGPTGGGGNWETTNQTGRASANHAA